MRPAERSFILFQNVPSKKSKREVEEEFRRGADAKKQTTKVAGKRKRSTDDKFSKTSVERSIHKKRTKMPNHKSRKNTKGREQQAEGGAIVDASKNQVRARPGHQRISEHNRSNKESERGTPKSKCDNLALTNEARGSYSL